MPKASDAESEPTNILSVDCSDERFKVCENWEAGQEISGSFKGVATGPGMAEITEFESDEPETETAAPEGKTVTPAKGASGVKGAVRSMMDEE